MGVEKMGTGSLKREPKNHEAVCSTCRRSAQPGGVNDDNSDALVYADCRLFCRPCLIHHISKQLREKLPAKPSPQNQAWSCPGAKQTQNRSLAAVELRTGESGEDECENSTGRVGLFHYNDGFLNSDEDLPRREQGVVCDKCEFELEAACDINDNSSFDGGVANGHDCVPFLKKRLAKAKDLAEKVKKRSSEQAKVFAKREDCLIAHFAEEQSRLMMSADKQRKTIERLERENDALNAKISQQKAVRFAGSINYDMHPLRDCGANNSCRFQVVLHRDASKGNGSLGFNVTKATQITNGRIMTNTGAPLALSNQVPGQNRPVGLLVTRVSSGSIASKANIQKGDEIVSANGVCLLKLSHNESIEVIQRCRGPLTLEIERKVSPQPRMVSSSTQTQNSSSHPSRYAGKPVKNQFGKLSNFDLISLSSSVTDLESLIECGVNLKTLGSIRLSGANADCFLTSSFPDKNTESCSVLFQSSRSEEKAHHTKDKVSPGACSMPKSASSHSPNSDVFVPIGQQPFKSATLMPSWKNNVENNVSGMRLGRRRSSNDTEDCSLAKSTFADAFVKEKRHEQRVRSSTRDNLLKDALNENELGPRLSPSEKISPNQLVTFANQTRATQLGRLPRPPKTEISGNTQDNIYAQIDEENDDSESCHAKKAQRSSPTRRKCVRGVTETETRCKSVNKLRTKSKVCKKMPTDISSEEKMLTLSKKQQSRLKARMIDGIATVNEIITRGVSSNPLVSVTTL